MSVIDVNSGAVDFTQGLKGCASVGAPLEVCPACTKLGQPKETTEKGGARVTVFVHTGVIERDRLGAATGFVVGAKCRVRR